MPRFSLIQWLLLLVAGAFGAGWLDAWARLVRLLRPDRPKYMAYMRQSMFRRENYTDETAATKAMWQFRILSLGFALTIVAILSTV